MGPAFKAGLRRGTKILAVNDRAYSKSVMIKAIIDNAGKKEPIRLLTKNNDKYRTFSVDYSGGLRYPQLEKLSNNKNGNSGGIDMLLKAQTK